MATRSSFPYPYGSDLHWLWGWGHRLDCLLTDKEEPGEFDCLIFRPCRQARKAMMRFSIQYPHVIKQIDDCLVFTEHRYEDFMLRDNESTRGSFANAMGELCRLIAHAAAIIYEHEQSTVAKPEAKIPAAKVHWRVELDPPKVTYDDGEVDPLTPDGALLLRELIRACPERVSASAIVGPQPKRVHDTLPKRVQSRIDRNNKGYRFEPPR